MTSHYVTGRDGLQKIFQKFHSIFRIRQIRTDDGSRGKQIRIHSRSLKLSMSIFATISGLFSPLVREDEVSFYDRETNLSKEAMSSNTSFVFETRVSDRNTLDLLSPRCLRSFNEK